MRLIILAVPVLAVLAACATTPRGQCESTQRNKLANVRIDIRETELNLQRGFRLVPATSKYGLHYCLSPGGQVWPCFNEEDEPMYDKRPINRHAENAKLAALREEQVRLNAELAQCAVLYPE